MGVGQGQHNCTRSTIITWSICNLKHLNPWAWFMLKKLYHSGPLITVKFTTSNLPSLFWSLLSNQFSYICAIAGQYLTMLGSTNIWHALTNIIYNPQCKPPNHSCHVLLCGSNTLGLDENLNIFIWSLHIHRKKSDSSCTDFITHESYAYSYFSTVLFTPFISSFLLDHSSPSCYKFAVKSPP